MVFNSFTFLFFFLVFFLAYYFVCGKRNQWQNICLLVASYFFYGYADWRMLPLLFISTLVFYLLGIYIEKAAVQKASLLTNLGVIGGIVILLYFKYLGFFIDSFAALFNAMGLHTNIQSFQIIMPIGISFFTFKLISYVVEIHRGHMMAERSFVNFATYISFFPCILSGPIDRPAKFLPQLEKTRMLVYNQAVDGCRQILWGLFKKVVIADTCAIYVDNCWNNLGFESSLVLIISMYVYMIQMYADFSGYSDMAIGVGKVMGFTIAPNFKYPLFALNMADYWRRWHMSLTGWLTDYVFMPLNIRFRNWGKYGIVLAIIINMIVVGFWHGANWTFGVFGLYHGLLFVPLIFSGAFFKKSKWKKTRWGQPALSDLCKMIMTVTLAAFGLVIFRADNIIQFGEYMRCACTSFSGYCIERGMFPLTSFLFAFVMLVVEWHNRKEEHGLVLKSNSHLLNFTIYYALLLLILFFGGNATQFIYFQF